VNVHATRVRQGPVAVAGSPRARLRPLAGSTIEAGFWADRQRLNREKLLLDGERRLEEAGNFHDLRAAAGRADGPYRGAVYMDSDLYKWLEALGWELGRSPSAELARAADDAIDLIAAAQDGDGFLHSY
jgi:uncharacterized protein